MRELCLMLAAALLLTGCGGRPAATAAADASSTSTSTDAAPAGTDDLPALDGPESLSQLTPVDFGRMEEEYQTEYSQYTIDPGGAGENTVYVLTGAEDGPGIYVVGGVHGDELAGWYAAAVLQRATLRAGTLYLLAPANRHGAEEERRTTRDDRDLNRNFPGDSQGNEGQQIARAIFDDLEDKAPELVLDLHEAKTYTDGWDNLGNSVICQDIQPVSELIFALLEQPVAGQSLDLFGSPPAGSLNRSVTQDLGIPVITVETARAEPLPQRVSTQLGIVEFILGWYGLR